MSPPGAGPLAAALRPAGRGDRAELVRLHAGSFADSETALLGPRYVGALFDAMASGPGGFVLLADDPAGRALGFVAGSPLGAEKARYRRLLPIAAASWLARPGLWRHPGLRRVARWRLGTLHRSTGSASTAALTPPVWLLDMIAVDPGARGRGVGDLLMTGFAEAARARGARSFVLWVRREAEGARRLYERHGWRELGPVEPDRLAYARAG